MKQIAQGQDFKDLSLKNRIYIDKTEQIYNLLQNDRVFISRPRRFGKSLMLDTIGTLFEDGVGTIFEDGIAPTFKDTWIYDKWTDKKYPVLRLNFLDYTSRYNKFCELFCKSIIQFAQKLNILEHIHQNYDPIDLLFNFFSAIDEKNKLIQHNEKEKKKISIVILIDEYDSQLTANINNPKLYKQFQTTLRELYGIIKGKSCIRFLGITGVTRLKDVSIFSVGSDIKDLSYYNPTSTIIGFTRDEIRKYYIDYINLAVSLEQKIPKEQVTEEQRDTLLDHLAEKYDGYCFDDEYINKVYSTWSVNSFFSEVSSRKKVIYGDYWYQNGGIPSILAKYLEKHTIQLEHYAEDVEIGMNEFWNPTSLLKMKQEVLMCQTGYLTVHSQLLEGGSVFLGFPNNEVQRAIEKLIANNIFQKASLSMEVNKKIFSTYTPEEIVKELNRLMNSISYEEYQNINERTVQGFIHAFMIGAGQNVLTERHNALGRSDIVIEYNNRRLVLELKYAETAQEAKKKLQEAIEQIRNKRYGDELPKKEVLKIALVFNGNPSVRQFTHYNLVQ